MQSYNASLDWWGFTIDGHGSKWWSPGDSRCLFMVWRVIYDLYGVLYTNCSAWNEDMNAPLCFCHIIKNNQHVAKPFPTLTKRKISFRGFGSSLRRLYCDDVRVGSYSSIKVWSSWAVISWPADPILECLFLNGHIIIESSIYCSSNGYN